MTHLLVLTSHRFGVLARITSIVSASGINIDTAAAYPVSGSDLAVVHLRIDADREASDRISRKLSRLVDVLEARTDDEERDGTPVHLGMLHRMQSGEISVA